MSAMPNMTEVSEQDSELYRVMRRIRRFEETVIELVGRDEIPGTTHEYIGQEAVAAGVCSQLRRSDVIASTHRGHGHVVAKGASLDRMLAELMARETGLNRGRGGSMHVADLSLGVLGANGIVAGGVPFVLGATWAARVRGEETVGVAFFGDGAMAQGLLYECLNLAALWQLPVVFVCENNGYAVSLKISDGLAGTVTSRADACGIPSTVVDGMDVRAVRAASTVAVDRARNGGGPSFVECITYRYAGHHTAEASLKLTYRTPEEIQQWRDRDPLLLAREWLPVTEADRIDEEVETEMEHAVAFGRASQAPDPASAMDFMYVVGNDRVRGVMG